MIRLALAFSIAAAAPAYAAPTLRAEALVSGELVTLGDLVDDAGGRAGIALFRAPAPGSTGSVPAETIIDAARRAGAGDISAGGVSEVAVTRASRRITAAEIEFMIADRAAAELRAAPENLEVRLDAGEASLHLASEITGALVLTRFVIDPRSGRFEASLDADGRSSAAAPLRVTGSAVETVDVAVPSRALGRGDILSASELRTERWPRMQAQDAIPAAEAAGLSARRPLREGQPLRRADLMRTQHVERGAAVTMIYAADGLSLTLRAKALGSGAQGDVIAVQNLQSKRVVNAVVSGPSQVTVTAAPTALARR
jgi:flagella basal body P-ring formation protein FlgA